MLFLLSFIPCEKLEFKPVAKVEMKTISDMMATTAIATGDIIDLGIGITDYGHCWDLSTNPTIAYPNTSLGSFEKKGTYTSELQNLEPGKTYYVKAYVKSGSDILYDKNSLSFTTPGNPLYIKCTIRNGTPYILEIIYELTLANIVSSASAFTVLVNSVSRTSQVGESVASGKLKESGTLHLNSPSEGTNESGFSALPTGDRKSSGVFNDLAMNGLWWSSKEYSSPAG